MSNPWENIEIESYEKHMSFDGVHQLQTINKMIKEQFNEYPVQSIMILGIAGGNGLEHIDTQKIKKVYGVDINEDYLRTCTLRFPELKGILETICADLSNDVKKLPHADLVIANLLIEFIGYECFQNVIKQVNPKYVSCIIQINNENSFVSKSPYIHIFDDLDKVIHPLEEDGLIESMRSIGYNKKKEIEQNLPNGKKFVRVDFMRRNINEN